MPDGELGGGGEGVGVLVVAGVVAGDGDTADVPEAEPGEVGDGEAAT